MKRLARLITAIILPTFIASLVFIGLSIYHDNYGARDNAILFGMYLIYGILLWSMPGLVIWLITESLWKANSFIRRPAVFTLTCGLLGLLGGLSLNPIAWLIWNARGQLHSYFLLGIIGAVATAIASWPLMRLQK